MLHIDERAKVDSIGWFKIARAVQVSGINTAVDRSQRLSLVPATARGSSTRTTRMLHTTTRGAYLSMASTTS
jgi:hypothetical protein